MPAPTREFLLDLLAEGRIKGEPLEARVTLALDPDYWRRLVPDFHVGDVSSSLELSPLDDADADVDEAIQGHRRDGYFQLSNVVGPPSTARLNAAIDAVVAAGWPASFVFAYDEAWLLVRSEKLKRVIESAIGPGFRQICHVWAHVVKPVVGATGWAPHTDGHTTSNPYGRFSAWIGLTESTLDNGCMHAVPGHVTSSVPGLVARFQDKNGVLTRPEVSSLLHAAHALVTKPGDAVGWGFDIIHWGGYVRRVGPERRSMSFEFLAADAEPEDLDGLVTSMDALPPFDVRMRSIATAVIAYRRFEPMVDRFAGIAAEIKARLA